jgi:23S rRNA pseudouridine1911/1915/1917 synthase
MSEPTQEPSDLASLVVAAEEQGSRLDVFLAHRNIVPSAGAARRAVAAGIVRVNGRPAKKGLHLDAGDTVQLADGPPVAVTVVATPELDIPVLYVDDALVAVAKPSGVPSHPLRPDEGATAAGAIVAKFPECAQASPDAREGGLGHRLDLGTSGVLLAARSREGWYRLREALASSGCEKTYRADVRGQFPSPERDFGPGVVPGPRPRSFVVTVPIGRQGRRSGKVLLDAGRSPLPARTEITLLEERAGGALVEARLAHGRAHQVRAHLAHLGLPVAGDATYGVAEGDLSLRLHALSISFLHPTTAQPMCIEAPPPAWAMPGAR